MTAASTVEDPRRLQQGVAEIWAHRGAGRPVVIPVAVTSTDIFARESQSSRSRHEEAGAESIVPGGRTADQRSSSTAITPDDPVQLRAQARALFQGAHEETFEDGMESRFSTALSSLIQIHGTAAVEVIHELISAGSRWRQPASEALRWLGRLEDPPTHAARLWVLEQALQHPSAQVRDAAGLGLASMDEPHAIPALIEAIARESVPSLRQGLQQVLNELRETAACPI